MTAAPYPPNTAAYGHFVQFYESDQFLIAEVAAFVGAGLRSGDAGIVIADPAHRRALRESLAADAAGTAEGAGPLLEFDAAEVLASILVDDKPDEALFRQVVGGILERAADGGVRRVRVYGELVALLCADNKHAQAVALEAFWNGLARAFEFKLFCGYPMKVFESGDHALAFEHVCHAHTLVRPAEGGAALIMGSAAGRTVATLQQKTRALSAELARRRAAERALQARDEALADFVASAVASLHQVAADHLLGRLSAGGTLHEGRAAWLRCLEHETVMRERDALLRRAPVAAAVLAGPEHRFELANSHFEERFGRCGLAGKPFREAFPELAATDLPDLLDRAYDSAKPFLAQAVTLPLHPGAGGRLSPCRFRLSVQPLRQPSGPVCGLMVVALDLSDRVPVRHVVELAGTRVLIG